MNTTKTELLEELESIVNLAMMQNRNARTSELARDYENGLIKNLGHFLDRYRDSVVKEGYLKAFDQIEQNLQEEKHESREKGIEFAIKAINLQLASSKYGCRFEFVSVGTGDAKDITFFNDIDERGKPLDFTRAFSREIARKVREHGEQTNNNTTKE